MTISKAPSAATMSTSEKAPIVPQRHIFPAILPCPPEITTPCLVEQLRQHRFVVEAVRGQNARDGDRMHTVTGEDLHPERLDGLMKRVGVARVTRPDVPGPFPFVEVDRDVERKSDRNRRRPGRLALVEKFLVLL